MDELPSLLNEPIHWVCEDCEDKMPIQSILHKTSKPVQANHSSNSFNDSSQLPIDTNDIENDICGRAQPVIDPIWRYKIILEQLNFSGMTVDFPFLFSKEFILCLYWQGKFCYPQ